jgi:hypothetical protein
VFQESPRPNRPDLPFLRDIVFLLAFHARIR